MNPANKAAGGLARWWWAAGARRAAIIEMVALAGILPGMLFLLAEAPVITFVIPALSLLPVLFGLRYGFVSGTVAALLVVALLAEAVYFRPHAMPGFPKLQAVVFLFCGAIAGQFRDHWAATLRHFGEASSRDRTRLAQFTSTFHLLQASHAQLERRLASSTSLRTALQRLKYDLPTMPDESALPLGGIGPRVLDLLVDAGNLHAAAVYAFSEHGKLAPTPLAMVGAAGALSPFNSLLREALASGGVVSVRADEVGVEQVIAVIPLVDSLGHIHGVISVSQMPFIAINQRNFDLLAIIARHAGDVLARRAGILAEAGSGTALRACLVRGLSHARQNRLLLAVVASTIVDPDRAGELVAHCLEINREMDQSWLCRNRLGHPVVVKLLALADEDAAQRQVQRLSRYLADCHGADAAPVDVQHVIVMVKADAQPDEALERILLACNIPTPPSQPWEAHKVRELQS